MTSFLSVGGTTALTFRGCYRRSAFIGEDDSGVLNRLAYSPDVVGTGCPNAVLKVPYCHFTKICLCAKSHARPVQ